MNVSATNLAHTVVIIIRMKINLILLYLVRARSALPVIVIVKGPFIRKGMLVTDLVVTNVAKTVLV
jgi:hypothetical protein